MSQQSTGVHHDHVAPTRPTELLAGIGPLVGAVQTLSAVLLRDAGVIFAYHHADADGLRSQLQYLRRRFDFVSLESLLSSRDHAARRSHRPQIALTFDDGYRDIYTDALPVLREEGIPATVFVVTDYIGTGRRFWWDQLDYGLSMRSGSVKLGSRRDAVVSARSRQVADARYTNDTSHTALLSWNEVHELHSARIKFGSHTQTHPILSRLNSGEIEHELRSSRRTLEQQLGVRIDTLAYPHGQAADMTPDVVRIARICGYSSAVTTIPGAVRAATDRLMLPRITVDCGESPRLVALKASGLWPLVIKVRRLMRTGS